MDDHDSISDSVSDGDSDSSVNSISISNSNSSNSEDERSNRITTTARSSSKRRNQTKASKSSGLKKNITQLPSTTTTTRKNRSSSSNNKNLMHNSSSNNNNNNDGDGDGDTAPSLLLQSNNTARRSKLAREHRITAVQEQEIQEVFHIFAEKKNNSSPTSSAAAAKKGNKKKSITTKKKKKSNHPTSQAKIHIINLRRALTALSLTPTGDELKEYISILDPEGEGLVEYEPFLAICALKINSRIVNSEDYQREVDEAWGLFVREGDDRITLAGLREIARSIGEDGVSDELLRDMVLEANGGAGLARGVEKGEFEDVMRKAGVWR